MVDERRAKERTERQHDGPKRQKLDEIHDANAALHQAEQQPIVDAQRSQSIELESQHQG